MIEKIYITKCLDCGKIVKPNYRVAETRQRKFCNRFCHRRFNFRFEVRDGINNFLKNREVNKS